MPIVTGDTFDLPIIFQDAKGVVANISAATQVKVAFISTDHTRVLFGPIVAASNYRDSDWAVGRVVVPILGTSTSALTDTVCLIEAQVTLDGQTTYFPTEKILIVKGLVT